MSRTKTRRYARKRNVGYVSYLAWCNTHEKKAFTKSSAKKVARQMNEQGIRKYPCDADLTGTWWHVGHLPKVVREGVMTAAEVYGNDGSQ